MGGGAPSAPQAPNPQQVSADQTKSNVETAVANATLGNTNQVTPYGNLTYTQTGGQQVGANWVPSYTATQTLSPSQQGIFNKTQGLQEQALDIAPGVLNNVNTAVNTQLPDVGKLRSDAYDALTSRTNQALDLQTSQQKAQLANQGIAAGSDAYNNAFRPIEQARVDASNQGVINAGNVASQNLSQAQTIRNQPLQDYATLIGFGGGVTQPTYAPSSAGSVNPTDVSSNYYNSYNGQLQQYQTQQGQQNALLGGLFGLGGSALGAGAYYARSDRRIKTDIKKLGTLDDGQNVYRFRYIGEPATHIGLMAQEVEKIHPEAVVTIGGIKMVDYARATNAG